MCLLFLFLIATFVGLAPIMVYRSLGVPLPDKLKGYRNVYAPLSFRAVTTEVLTSLIGISRQPWIVVPQPSPADGPPPLDGANIQTQWTAQWQDPETTTKPKPVSIPKAHIRPPIPAQFSTSITSDPPT